MVTLHILQLLQDNGFGTIDALADGLYFETLPLNGRGVAIFSRGTSLRRGQRTQQSFDLYSRGTDNLNGAEKLEQIKEYFDNNFVQCTLPTTELSSNLYTRASIEVVSNVENLGLDETDRIIFRLSAVITYNKE